MEEARQRARHDIKVRCKNLVGGGGGKDRRERLVKGGTISEAYSIR